MTAHPTDRPVRAADEHCAILLQWLDLIEAKAGEDDAAWTESNPALMAVATAAWDIRIAIFKSSYLGRRLYGDEEHRTERCPVHQGKSSGLPVTASQECACGLTGLLPAN